MFIPLTFYIDSWSLEDLSTELQVDQPTVRHAVNTWIKHGVLRENHPNNFILLEEATGLPTNTEVAAPVQCLYFQPFYVVFMKFDLLAYSGC